MKAKIMQIRAYIFYGCPLHGNTIRMLEKRDEERGLMVCPVCKGRGESNYCPDDGTRLISLDVPPGLKSLRAFREGAYEQDIGCSIRYGCGAQISDDAHFLYLKGTLKRTKMHTDGFAHKYVGDTFPDSYCCDEFKKVCEYLKITYVHPGVYIGLQWEEA